MSLRSLHDFELALVEPCAAMTARGLRVGDVVYVNVLTGTQVGEALLVNEANVLARGL